MAKAAVDGIDYSDRVRNIREYAARLNELAQHARTQPEDIHRAVAHLEASARALEERQGIVTPEQTAPSIHLVP